MNKTVNQSMINNKLNQDNEIHPIFRVKHLLPKLKESLATLMTVAANIFRKQCKAPGNTNPDKEAMTSFIKTLEKFYSYCNIIEMNLQLALGSIEQQLASIKNTPINIATGHLTKPNIPGHHSANNPELIPPGPALDAQLNNYVSMIRTQISSAKDIYDMLCDTSNRIGQPSTMQHQHQHHQQHQQQQHYQQQQQQQHQQQHLVSPGMSSSGGGVVPGQMSHRMTHAPPTSMTHGQSMSQQRAAASAALSVAPGVPSVPGMPGPGPTGSTIPNQYQMML